jgi:hypothetical protein
MFKVPRRHVICSSRCNQNLLVAINCVPNAASNTASVQEKTQYVIRFGLYTYHIAMRSASFTYVCGLLGYCSFNVVPRFLNMHKEIKNGYDTWRFTFLRTSKIACNDCHELELCKHYDSLGLHLNEHHNTDYVRTIILLSLSVGL